MSARWPASVLPLRELGAVVHGPVLLARSPGIAAGLRCVFAHASGLHLPLVLHAEGVRAEAAMRRTFPTPGGTAEIDPWSGPVLTVELDGETRTADAGQQESSGGSTADSDVFDLAASYWIGRLPPDGVLGLTFAWPEAGLARSTVALRLGDLSDVAARVVALG
jgi:hypothetical protein